MAGVPGRAVPARPWWSRRITWLIAVGGVLIIAAGAAIAVDVVPTTRPANSPAPAPPVQATPNSPVPSAAVNPSPVPPGQTGLVAEFAHWQTRLHAKTGLVVRPVGAPSAAPVTLGDWTSGPAWSTIKVPLVMAAMRRQQLSRPTPAMTAAITESDNAAAESIWAGLGDPATAAATVGAVLHETGDPTVVESRKLRPEYTAFGQTDWSLANQAVFLSSAACDARNQPVLNLMGEVQTGQKWGLGGLPGTKIKGGWGPSTSGRYLVRQIGMLPTPHGLTVVAMAVEPDSGSFADGTDALDQIADWLDTHLAALAAGQCGR